MLKDETTVYVEPGNNDWLESLIGVIPGLINVIWGDNTTTPPVTPPVTPPTTPAETSKTWVWVVAGFGVVLFGLIIYLILRKK